jgi:hypothetical protein
MRRWRKLGEAPVNVADAIPEVAAASSEAATTASAPDVEPPASKEQRNPFFAAGEVAAQVAAHVRSTVPPMVVATRKCTGRELNPYALRRRNLKTGDCSPFCSIQHDSTPSGDEIARDEARSEDALPHRAAGMEPDPVDVALARALADASAAGRFDIVVRLLEELRARRQERSR